MMETVYICFTEKGRRLAMKLAEALGGTVEGFGRGDEEEAERSPGHWMAENFPRVDSIVFIGAAGIAVRLIAPHVRSKVSDPAVVVVDEGGGFAVSLLSGHIGGGNDLTRRIAETCGAVPVITTATDINGVFAVDEWAKRQGFHILNPERIKDVSSSLLAGKAIDIRCEAEISGELPEGVRQISSGLCDAAVSIFRDADRDAERERVKPLILVPRIAVLGIGCRRGSSAEKIESCFSHMLEEAGIYGESVCAAASIDLKKDEKGLLEFCESRGLPFRTYTAEELKAAEGEFSSSEFVRSTTGVDNVCERSAVLCSQGKLYIKKHVEDGVTMALALKGFAPDWRWKYE